MKTNKNRRVAPQDTLTVGQIGLGIMGGAYAKHLRASGFNVTGYDLDAACRAKLKALGGTPVKSAGAVSAACSVVITSLPSVQAVDAAFFA
ncbi:MAG: NAD(P)-binding domain-containing protein [Pseudomonadota bacterium]